MRNPFKHRHNIKSICHCDQIMCDCGKHLWQIIEESEKKIDKKNKDMFFKLNEDWYSINGLIKICKEEKLRFYSREIGELDYAR